MLRISDISLLVPIEGTRRTLAVQATDLFEHTGVARFSCQEHVISSVKAIAHEP